MTAKQLKQELIKRTSPEVTLEVTLKDLSVLLRCTKAATKAFKKLGALTDQENQSFYVTAQQTSLYNHNIYLYRMCVKIVWECSSCGSPRKIRPADRKEVMRHVAALLK